jgi:hypothetical protein
MNKYMEIHKILLEKQHHSDRKIESRLNELMAIVKNLERECSQVNIDRFLTFHDDNILANDLMECDDDNLDILDLSKEDYLAIKATQEELLTIYGFWDNRGWLLVD